MRVALWTLACTAVACGPTESGNVCTRGPVTLEPWVSIPSSGISQQMQVGLDREGMVQLLSVETYPADVFVLRPTHDAGAPQPSRYPTLDNPYPVALRDMNRDGWPDLVTGHGDGSAAILLGAASGYQAPRIIPGAGPNAIWGLATADLDQDGWPDLVAGSLYSGQLNATLNKPDAGGFVGGFSLDAGGPTGFAQTADFDRDGQDDVVFTRFFFGIATLFSVSDGGLPRLALTQNPVGGNMADLAVADIDGQLGPDVVQAGANSTTVVFFNQGDGTFISQQVFSGGSQVAGVAAGDLDLDGRPDIVTSDFDEGTLTVLINRGDGGFTATTFDAGVLQAAHVGIADLDGDGLPDVAVSGEYATGLFHNVTVDTCSSPEGVRWVGTGCETVDGRSWLLGWLLVIRRRPAKNDFR